MILAADTVMTVKLGPRRADIPPLVEWSGYRLEQLAFYPSWFGEAFVALSPQA